MENNLVMMISTTTTRKVSIMQNGYWYNVCIDFDVSDEEIIENIKGQLLWEMK